MSPHYVRSERAVDTRGMADKLCDSARPHEHVDDQPWRPSLDQLLASATARAARGHGVDHVSVCACLKSHRNDIGNPSPRSMF